MSDEEKEPFLVKAAKEMKLELQRKWEIEFGPGHYELEDGSKSIEPKNKLASADEKLEAREKQAAKQTSLVLHPSSAYKEFVSVRAAQLQLIGKPESRCYVLARREWELLAEEEKQPYEDEAMANKALWERHGKGKAPTLHSKSFVRSKMR